MESLPKDIQAELAKKALQMLISRVRSDEKSDHSGFNISKKSVYKHAAKVVEDIERGALQPIKHNPIL